MAACDCPGCGGHPQWRAEQAAKAEANRLDFQAWLAAGQPDIKEWHAKRAERDAAAQVNQPVGAAK
jgi:hypothetical protein